MSNYITIKLRRGTAAQWTSSNPTLAEGEMGLETDTLKFKVGDGASAWNDLSYWNTGGGGGSGTVTSVAQTVPTGFSVSGSPITGAGTLAITYATGYQGYTTTEANKLSGIEAGATADMSAAEIKIAYESNTDTNAFTDAEQSKLSSIETNADVTDAANVDAAGAVMNSDTSTAAMSFVIDEDNMSSDSATKIPTQQSVKAYADTKVAKTSVPCEFIIACSDLSTALTTGTGKAYFRAPYAFTLTAVRASLGTAQTSGSIFTVDVNESGTSVLSTKLTIDNTEKTSTTAATAAVISDSSIADDSEITIDIDQVGDGTAKGLIVTLIGTHSV